MLDDRVNDLHFDLCYSHLSTTDSLYISELLLLAILRRAKTVTNQPFYAQLVWTGGPPENTEGTTS
jgi:hypothetical protein